MRKISAVQLFTQGATLFLLLIVLFAFTAYARFYYAYQRSIAATVEKSLVANKLIDVQIAAQKAHRGR